MRSRPIRFAWFPRSASWRPEWSWWAGAEARAVRRLDRLLTEISAIVVPFDDHHATIAREAFARFGKGRHPAGLNFGDCAAYALAIAEAEPLLFKGTDFDKTDVEVVGV